jgi:hypothetical protein
VSTIASQFYATRARRDVQADRAVGGVRGPAEKAQGPSAEVGGASAGARQQAAVLHWGSEALRLARGAQPGSGPPAAEASDTAPGAARENEPRASGALAPAAGDEAVSEAEADGSDSEEVSEEEAEEVRDLEKRDREVRTHEQAHKSAGGSYAGSIHLDYATGPNGKRYASSGSVSIDVSPVKGDPEATLRKMQIVQRAATAPADPSGADRQVASRAASTASQARAELAAKRYSEAQKQGPA